jgi:prolyl 4-hydroxylase
LTTTAEITRAANGPYTPPPQRVSESDRPCRLIGADEDRPRFAVLDAPVLALRLFYRLVDSLPLTRDGAELVGLKPLLRCVEYRRNEGTQSHRDPIRESIDGLRSAMSVLVFLNDQFEGGGVEFPELGRCVEAKVGRAIVFPHSLMHIDHVVERGRKFVLETDVFYAK